MGRGSAVAVASRAIVSVSLASGGARRESLIPISQHGEPVCTGGPTGVLCDACDGGGSHATRKKRPGAGSEPSRCAAVRSRSLIRGQRSARTADPVSPPPGLELPPCELCRLPDRARALRFASTLLVGVPPLRPPSLLLPFTPHALPSEHPLSLALPHRLAATASPRARCALVLRKSRRLGRLWRRASLTAALPSIAPVPTASPLRPDP